MTWRNLDIFLLRGAAGGSLVVLFALIGEFVKPKAFSGLFSSAPSVAIASLAVTLVAEDVAHARQDVIGMVVGGIGMTACCVVAAVAIPRAGALWGSLFAWISWTVIALGIYWAVFIGAH